MIRACFIAVAVGLSLGALAGTPPPANCADPLVVAEQSLLMDCTREAATKSIYLHGLNWCEARYGTAVQCAVKHDRDGLRQFSDANSVELARRYTEWLDMPDHSQASLFAATGYPDH